MYRSKNALSSIVNFSVRASVGSVCAMREALPRRREPFERSRKNPRLLPSEPMTRAYARARRNDSDAPELDVVPGRAIKPRSACTRATASLNTSPL